MFASARGRFFAFALISATSLGCETPDDDYPLGHETIHVGQAQFGEAVEVSISQQTDEWEFCHPRMGEFGPWIDCEETRQRTAKLVSIECTPAEACRDVKTDGSTGSFLPVALAFSVKVVGDIEGSRVETAREVKVVKPAPGIHFSPDHPLAGAPVSLCRSVNAAVDSPEVRIAVTLDGTPIEATEKHPTRSECSTVFVPGSPGTLRAVPTLVDPEVELEAVTATVHPISDVSEVAIHDSLCSSRVREIGAYRGNDGTYLVSVSAIGMLATSPTSKQSTPIPASRIRLSLGGVIVEHQGSELTGSAFTLDAAPPAGSRVEVDLDDRIESLPLRAKQCD